MDYDMQILPKKMGGDIRSEILRLKRQMRVILGEDITIETLDEFGGSMGDVQFGDSSVDGEGIHSQADLINIDWWLPLTTAGDSVGNVEAIAIDETNGYLYVGGQFGEGARIGGVDMDKAVFARLDFSTLQWEAIGEFTNSGASSGRGRVRAMDIASNGDIYFGGDFDDIVGSTGTDLNIAYYDESANAFIGLGYSGIALANLCSAIAIDSSDNVYFAINDTDIGGVTGADYWAMYDGSWNKLGNSSAVSVNPTDFYIDQSDNVYAVGDFTNVDSDANIDYIFKWNGTAYSQVGNVLTDRLSAVTEFQGRIYCGVGFLVSGSDYNVYYLDDNDTWQTAFTPATSGQGTIRKMITDDDYLYVMGDFSNVAVDNTENVFRYDGTEMLPIAARSFTGTSATIYDGVLDSDGNLFVVGNFDSAGSVGALNIAANCKPLSFAFDLLANLVEWRHNASAPDTARMNRNTAQTGIVSGTVTKIDLNNTSYDQGGIADPTTNNRIDIKRDGFYDVVGKVTFDSLNDGDRVRAYIYVNGAVVNYNQIFAGAAGNQMCQVATGLDLSIGDYVELWAQHNYGSNRNTTTGAGTLPFLVVTENLKRL